MSTNFKIGSYTICSESYYNALNELGITKDEDLKILDKNQDNQLTEDELVSAELTEEENSTEQTSTEQTAQSQEDQLASSLYEQTQMYLEMIRHLQEQRNMYDKRAGSTEGDAHEANMQRSSEIGTQIDNLRKNLLTLITSYNTQIANLQNGTTTTADTATLNTATDNNNTTGNYVIGEHNWNFNFTESLSDYNVSELDSIKQTYQENIDKYKAVEAATGVPAELICAIHYREGSCDFTTYLHNGDPLGSPTVHYPYDVLFYDWTEAAIDAINSVGMSLDPNDLDSCLDYAERYNGLGYRNRGLASPYVWAGTTTYTGGMYVADGEFSSSAYDQRVGVAVILKALCT